MAKGRNIVYLIDRLRAGEGSYVMIHCPNPDPESREEQEEVDVSGEWLGWTERRFAGATLEDALSKAVAAMEQKQTKTEKG